MKVKMLVVQGRPTGKTLTFLTGDFYFGRGKECHVRPNSEWVSRQHCLLRVTPTAAYLRDLGSRNGTLVNGVLLSEERLLQDGDQVQLGQLVFEIQLESDTPARRADKPPLADTDQPLPRPTDSTTEIVSALETTEHLPIYQPESEGTKS